MQKDTGTMAMAMPRSWLAIVALIGCAVAMFGADRAEAKSITPIYYSGTSFNGEGSTAGTFSGLQRLAIDEEHSNIYTWETGNPTMISRFDMSGVPVPFPGLGGASSFAGPLGNLNHEAGLVVDNSPGSAGTLYAAVKNLPVHSYPYAYEGTENPGFPVNMLDTCDLGIDPEGDLWYSHRQAEKLRELNSAGVETGNEINPRFEVCQFEIDGEGNFYAHNRDGLGQANTVWKYNPEGTPYYKLNLPEPMVGLIRAVAVDRISGQVYVLKGLDRVYVFGPNSPDPTQVIGLPDPGHGFGGLSGATAVDVDGTTHKVAIGVNGEVHIFAPDATVTVPDSTTGAVEATPNTATLLGTVNPDGVETTECYFEWGTTSAYGNTVPCNEGNVFGGTEDVDVSADIEGLTKGVTYHYRLAAKNASGFTDWIDGADREFAGQDVPQVSGEFVTGLHSDLAHIHATIDPEEGVTTAQVEYGLDSSYGSLAPVPGVTLESRTNAEAIDLVLKDLEPGTEYHYRVRATNYAGTTTSSSDHTFSTYPLVQNLVDPCPNALAREQTKASQLLDCRAHELVSASNTGGYNVESSLVPGQTPLSGYPDAQGRAVYGIHNGGVPGSGSPTNFGVDPYLAVRSDDGWTTRYVGIPADSAPSEAPFSSSLLAAAAELDTFVFGGENVCDPCFEDGSSGIPVRMADETLEQGMRGELDPGPGVSPNGLVVKPLSADGSHLVFGAVPAYEADGNNGTGDISIYDRNLETGVTQVVSKNPAGENLACLQGVGTCSAPGNPAGIAQLDISADGSRIVVAQRVSTDAAGNHFWHPYMHIGTSPETVDLAPGTTSGVLFVGMSGDGRSVFLNTPDALLPGDTDESFDIYEAVVDGTGELTLRLITTKGGVPSNDDGCSPPGEPKAWNVVAGPGKCDAVAFAGGAGVASGNGTFYFVSPEQLDGSEGLADQVNLYAVGPGEDPKFVGVIDSGIGATPPPPERPLSNPFFIGGTTSPEAMAVDQSNGDIYIAERTAGRVSRFDSTGAPKNFTAGPWAGGNMITFLNQGNAPGRSAVAVDNAGTSPFDGHFYVRLSSSTMLVLRTDGEFLGTIEGFTEVCGIAVDQSSGDVYVGDRLAQTIWRLEPSSATPPVTAANYTKTGLKTESMAPCNVAADTGSRVYAAESTGGPLRAFDKASFGAVPAEVAGLTVAPNSLAATVDSSNDDVYVNEGNQITRYDDSGSVIQSFGSGFLSGSRGVAINEETEHVYAPLGFLGAITEFGVEPQPFEPITNPAVLNGVEKAGTLSTSDFQVSPDGRFATFASSQPLTGDGMNGKLGIFRYDRQTAELDCVSCAPTKAVPETDSWLATHGRSLTDDGRVYFTTADPLVLRDTNATQDAYEWSDGVAELISSGSDRFGSRLFSVSSDGKDAFFFTRETLAREDHNGTLVKLYDAREGGGFFRLPPTPACAASDECHGPGTVATPPPVIGSVAGTAGNVRRRNACKKGFVRKKGKCVRKHRRKHRKCKKRFVKKKGKCVRKTRNRRGHHRRARNG